MLINVVIEEIVKHLGGRHDQHGHAGSRAISRRPDVSTSEKKRAVAEYGKVEYADPKNKKYPLDKKHVRAAWSYIHMPKNRAKYNSKELSVIESRIARAWKKHHGVKPPALVHKSETELELIAKSWSNEDNAK